MKRSTCGVSTCGLNFTCKVPRTCGII